MLYNGRRGIYAKLLLWSSPSLRRRRESCDFVPEGKAPFTLLAIGPRIQPSPPRTSMLEDRFDRGKEPLRVVN